MPKKLTQEEFIERAGKIHIDENGNHKYDYSLVKYVNNHTKVKIICHKEGHGEFLQTPNDHINRKSGCKECGIETMSLSQLWTIEKFIERAQKIHIDENRNPKYDYFIYFGNEVNIPIFCHKEGHGIFWQTPHSHLKGSGCQKCGLDINKQLCDKKRHTTDEFVEKAKSLHMNKETNLPKYDYSLVNYINAITKVKIICPEHGEFEQTPNAHLSPKGCEECSFSHKPTLEEFITKAREIYGNKYDYFVYNDCKIEVPIFCRIHGIFWKTPDKHLNQNCGCHECAKEKKTTNLKEKYSTEFKEKVALIHGDRYEYLSEYINNRTKMKMFCSKEGHGIFWQMPMSHLIGRGCPICKESKGENEIRIFLEKNNINFIRQQKFDGCKNIFELPFDFYLSDYNLCVEYDGEFHYKSVEYFGGEKTLKNIQKNDRIKTKYCKNNNIKLLRIPYWNFKDIEEILIGKLYINSKIDNLVNY